LASPYAAVTMFRPWRQDERPTWRAAVQHLLIAPLDPAACHAIVNQAVETGLAARVVVKQEAGSVAVHLLIKADHAGEAAHVAARVVEAAHREARHGLLGRQLRSTATRLEPPGRPPPDERHRP